MNPDTLTALRASIAHWERVVADPEWEVTDVSQCELCRRFNENHLANYKDPKVTKCTRSGERCPIYAHTGKPYCEGTPYELTKDEFLAIGGTEDEWEGRYWTDYINYSELQDLKVLTAILKAQAQKELDFLRSLLPSTELQGKNENNL